MLDGLLRQTELLQLAPEVRDLDRLVDHLAAERLANGFRDAIPIHLHRPEAVKILPGMRTWIPQHSTNTPAPVFRPVRPFSPLPDATPAQPLPPHLPCPPP